MVSYNTYVSIVVENITLLFVAKLVTGSQFLFQHLDLLGTYWSRYNALVKLLRSGVQERKHMHPKQ